MDIIASCILMRDTASTWIKVRVFNNRSRRSTPHLIAFSRLVSLFTILLCQLNGWSKCVFIHSFSFILIVDSQSFEAGRLQRYAAHIGYSPKVILGDRDQRQRRYHLEYFIIFTLHFLTSHHMYKDE